MVNLHEGQTAQNGYGPKSLSLQGLANFFACIAILIVASSLLVVTREATSACGCLAVSSLSLAMNTLPVSIGWWLEGELGVGGRGERWVCVYASAA